MTDVQQLVREYREHYQQHREPRCELCQLWVAYRDGDEGALNTLAGSDNGYVCVVAEAFRPHLGEGEWTDRESE